MKKFFSRKILWVVLALTLPVIGEGLLRTQAGLGHPLLLEKDADIGYRYRANQSLCRFGREVRINAFHQRSAGVSPQPAPGTDRILMIGDSVTFGTTLIGQSEIISELLGAGLRRNQPAEVLNASAGSWGLGNELAYLQRFGTFGARVVVLQIGSHDLLQKKSGSDRVGIDPEMPDRNPATALGELWSRYVKPRLTGPAALARSSAVEGLAAESQFLTNMLCLVEAIRIVSRGGAVPVILHTPDRNEVAPVNGRFETKYESWRKRFLEIARDQGVRVINLVEAWRSDPAAVGYYLDHVHLSRAGNAVVARSLCAVVQESKVTQQERGLRPVQKQAGMAQMSLQEPERGSPEPQRPRCSARAAALESRAPSVQGFKAREKFFWNSHP